ncbi:MAG: bifunctional [glutamate--ammonia ligase]-adenylyl-L-tyrosine phosphorylase/[glutamate--ammonia-ligase] adenylyltransferase [Methylococcales symbiont of Iophon sp. n. MRB-2018]|nr:MAG: bifunctional [glutamate--ammonia ligase]-adenylyl-L-tyrosine phosphorylase/[glutamate--ammonia-ligase] adenylyltransferase [Methylococcales symbiont of Iophon sp. n. MRB-2018]KAF3980632.1 MAG: bifunctional [glutamate--ammonia ligase]-adenylyl-L-tyrosine phosphorylase/[glutamate--ammonia-ligase] adenylyltransferase [Methylococcales symbiont of Iophon sp. n. MRB-2018]
MRNLDSYVLDELPFELKEIVSKKIALYEEKLLSLGTTAPSHTDFLKTIPTVFCGSDFVAENCIRSPDLIHDLVVSGDLFSAECRSNYTDKLKTISIDSELTLMRVLRQIRNREMVRIAWRDLATWSDLNETLADLTELAEVCIKFALDYLYSQACKNKGEPTNSKGKAINIVVIGMGKLGAWELNYSSDIDLIFAYAEDGVLNDRKKTSYREFFSRICRNLVKVLDQITADGFVFRTDIRLRPFGDSGPIIMNFDGMENYYLTQAREWERYAMIKARQVAGDFDSGKQLFAMIKPFVYRRYLDYGAFEELRSLKRQISRELKRKDHRDNIKLGTGGIREIEFIGQAFQLIRGGQDIDLQQRSILKILKLLAEKQLLSIDEACQLQTSYTYLRRVENHIQQHQDKQTHDLPLDPIIQQTLAYTMGFTNWDNFKKELDHIRKEVQSVFDQVFSLAGETDSENNATIVWHIESKEKAQSYLRQLNFKQTADSLKVIQDFKQSAAIKRLSNKGIGVINRIIPLLIDLLATIENNDETLKRVLHLFEQVAGRNVYLSLLAESTNALTQLIKLSSASPWICEYLAKYPVLFDELLDTRSLYEPLNKQQLNQQLATCLKVTDSLDIEQLMIKLRQFKHINILRIAAADIMGIIPLMTVSNYLTIVAEVIVEHVIQHAWTILGDKHGYPPNTSAQKMNFAVLGFGKLGGMELGYSSDLDMVFISDNKNANILTNGDKAISCAQFYGRLGQKIRHILDTKMLSGVVYQVDMRLRPSGESGLLVTAINSYEEYLKNTAWTWEHQALVRARFIAGDTRLQQRYKAIRQRILCQIRNKNALKKDVNDMRNKMRESLAQKEGKLFDLKHCIGGIVDIEFIVQSLVLIHASDNKSLSSDTANIDLLDKLNQLNYISNDELDILKTAYCQYRDYGHQQALQGKKIMISNDDFSLTRQKIERIWHKYIKDTDK